MTIKSLLFGLLLLPALSFGQCIHIDSVYNKTELKSIENRNILFGIKQITEDLLQEKGYDICPNQGSNVNIEIISIGLPENTFRIAGFALQNKITEIKVNVIIDGQTKEGVGTYKTSTNAMMLEINEEVPFKQTVLSNAIKLSLIDALK
jgi:uncharacterized lipoprotein YajG